MLELATTGIFELALAGFIFVVGSCALGATVENLTFRGIVKIKEKETDNNENF